MPTNRKRRARGRADLDNFKLAQLVNGPEDCLIAGDGYHEAGTKAFYWNASETGQQAILDEMRRDWLLHHLTVKEAADSDPWAQGKFGDVN